MHRKRRSTRSDATQQRNGLAERVRAIRADAFDQLKALREARERFDVVILDPPAFVKRKKDFAEGRLAYRRLNELGNAGAGEGRDPDHVFVLVSHAARGVARNGAAGCAASRPAGAGADRSCSRRRIIRCIRRFRRRTI